MDYNYERKLEINEWIITTRWFYMVAVLLIGILGNSLFSLFTVKSSFFSISFLLIIFLIINSYLHYYLTEIKKNESRIKLKYLGIWQILIELIIFTIVLYLLGDKPTASLFFFLPIISASIIFGVKGAVITALLSGALVNLSVVIEYFDLVAGYLFHRDFLNTVELIEIRYSTFALIKVITTSNFYLILGVVAGYTSKHLFKREQKLIEHSQQLDREKAGWAGEIKRMGSNAQLLAKRDEIITKVNRQLNAKIKELEKSEKSLMRAFSDLKNARKSTEEERNKTAAIVSNFIDPIIVIDKFSKINLINPAAKDIFGFIDDDLGKKVSAEDNYSMINIKKIIKRDFQVKSSRELKSHNPNEEEIIIEYSGQELTYKVITAKVVDHAGVDLGVMKIFYNLTREKMIDKLKSEFISIAAHQLRTPLSAIKWVIKMILDGDTGKLNEEQQKLLFKGYQSNERIISLVNDMLNVSRIEEGRFGYSFKKEDFVKTLQFHIDNLENLIKDKSIKLTVEKPVKPPSVYMDKQKMGLVLQNILENAVKYTPEFGKIKIALEAGEQFLKVRIKDNGVGIPEKDKTKLFSKFFRAENVMRMQTEGSGLGLFIAKNIVKKHGGEISVESKEGRGTEFVFTLPLRKQKEINN
ncbi:hypothetical protein DRH27_01405 [Candidatus Falkowbacteria bacterium]|nr:MAG: hypothetical protein DRH27_01405 [Candidatus Falkowbacteria bacterium]